MRVAVVGRGLIGAAAARHLAKAGIEVVLIGPDEPLDKQSHHGVFGSHYDAGRITRRLDADPFWAEVATSSIARYREISEQSGVSFFSPVGALMSGPSDGDMARGVRNVLTGMECAEELDQNNLHARFPFLNFPGGIVGFHEAEAAGYVDPRKLIVAQSIAAEKHGACIVRLPVQKLYETLKGVRVEMHGQVCEVDQVLVAAGAYTNSILSRPLEFTTYARTVALLEVDTVEQQKLAKMPSMIYRFPDGRDPYLLPPIRYPDGKTYLKIGGDPEDIVLSSAQDISRWFRSGGDLTVGHYLAEMAREIIPDLRIGNLKTDACAVMYTKTGLPYIDRVTSRISVATGGCGAGAKCSDELGRLGAEAIQGRVQTKLEAVFKESQL